MEAYSGSQGGLKLETSPSSTKIAYYDGDYIKSLYHLLLGVQARDDVPITIGGVWEALGTRTTTSATNTFVISNFSTNFNVYLIQIAGAKANNTATSFNAEWSKDNGDTAVTAGGNYNYQFTAQLTATPPSATSSSVGASAIVLPTTLLNGTTHRRWLSLFVLEPANPNLESSILYKTYTFDRASPFSTQYAMGWGTFRTKEAHNAIRLNITGGRTWTAGEINVWGQSV